jgi:toxin ParE1/3/4
LSGLRLEISEAAANDILEQADWYAIRADEQLAVRWERAVTATVLHVLDYPHAAPIATFKNPKLSEIRRIPVEDFPRHQVFYRVTETAIKIVRVLHGARDLESLFS